MRRNHNTNHRPTVTRFALGQTYITPGAEEALQIAGQTAIEFLRRHMSCDWGELSDDDVQELAFVKEGFSTSEQLPDGQRAAALDHYRS